MIRQSVILAGLVCLVLLLAACGTSLPNTASKDHLGRYAAEAAVARGQALDPAVRETILSEPALRFPARIGLVRLESGAVSSVPQGEAEAWLAMVKELGPGWGEFVPIGPLEVAPADPQGVGPADIATTLRSLRRSAARQQLDAVLIYEVFAGRPEDPGHSSLGKLAPVADVLALIAAGRPEEQAQGVLVDARHGAIYGYAAGGAEAAAGAAGDRSGTAVAGLARETGKMLRDLRIELAEARAAKAEAEH